VDEFGSVTALAHNAGVQRTGYFTDLTDESREVRERITGS
jgi:hypothetical protein